MSGADELREQLAAAVGAKRARSARSRRVAIVVCAFRDPRGRTCGRRIAEVLVDADGARTVELRAGAWRSASEWSIVVNCPTHGPAAITAAQLDAPTPVAKGPSEIRIHRSLP